MTGLPVHDSSDRLPPTGRPMGNRDQDLRIAPDDDLPHRSLGWVSGASRAASRSPRSRRWSRMRLLPAGVASTKIERLSAGSTDRMSSAFSPGWRPYATRRRATPSREARSPRRSGQRQPQCRVPTAAGCERRRRLAPVPPQERRGRWSMTLPAPAPSRSCGPFRRPSSVGSSSTRSGRQPTRRVGANDHHPRGL